MIGKNNCKIYFEFNDPRSGFALGLSIEEGVYAQCDENGEIVEERNMFRMVLGFLLFNIELLW